MPTPDWIQDAIFYQIFPDRFMDGDPSNDPAVVLPWNQCATPRAFMGGDLRGIEQRLDYLLDLGVNAIYLNPIFTSPSNHRYNTTDYFQIDPKLGNMDDFRSLIQSAHSHGIRVILDGVFNHTGRGFFAFNDILENGDQSPYKDWFHIKHFPVDAYSPGEARDYVAWWGHKSLPKLNTDNPKVRVFLLDVARYWIEQGADGWRLDVPNEIDDDYFWADFRRVVREANPQAVTIGEIWDALPRWVGENHFDGLMNYPLRTAVLGLLAGNWTPSRFAAAIDKLLATYPRENTFAMFNLLGSHDTERVLTMLGNDINKAKLAALYQFAYPGTPSIYYGDEIGLTGGKDPECRLGFPWDERFWNQDLHAWYKQLTHVRAQNDALRRGDYLPLAADDEQRWLAFARRSPEQTVLVIINSGPEELEVCVTVGALGWQDGRELRSLLDSENITVEQGDLTISLAPWSGIYLV